jgi:hypothetical protein
VHPQSQRLSLRLCDGERAKLSIACVSQGLLGESLFACIVACKQECGMMITVRNHVRSAVDQILLEALMKLRQQRPMDPGMVVMFEVKTDIEHCKELTKAQGK